MMVMTMIKKGWAHGVGQHWAPDNATDDYYDGDNMMTTLKTMMIKIRQDRQGGATLSADITKYDDHLWWWHADNDNDDDDNDEHDNDWDKTGPRWAPTILIMIIVMVMTW